MTTWAHTLVKNEARWLWYSVSSVIEHVDKMLLWDAGSTDKTLEIEKALINRYPDKILFKKRPQTSIEDFTIIRQEMLDATKSDWVLMVDGDEIWWEDTILSLLSEMKHIDKKVESIVVPTINVVGDIFHYQERLAGKYNFGDLKGHYNLRVFRRSIPGLHSQGTHGVWGWADGNNKMIQNRNSFKFVDAPYMHTTFLQRSSDLLGDSKVNKRAGKLKYELGISFPKDFYYPESLFNDRPDLIESCWRVMGTGFKVRAFFETPLRKINRKIFNNKIGY